MAPHIGAMRRAGRGSAMRIRTGVNVKATTTEQLGLRGAREGIATEAVVLLVKQ